MSRVHADVLIDARAKRVIIRFEDYTTGDGTELELDLDGTDRLAIALASAVRELREVAKS